MPESAPNGRVLNAKQEAVALLMAHGNSQAEAAREARVGERTIRTWLHDIPEFGQRISEIRDELTSAALGRLTDGMVAASLKLHFLILSGKTDAIQLRAAVSLLEMQGKLRQNHELVAELEAIKELLASKGLDRETKRGGRRTS